MVTITVGRTKRKRTLGCRRMKRRESWQKRKGDV